jgi:hypothetical protein
MKIQIRSLATRLIAVTVLASMVAGAAPAAAGVLGDFEADPIQAKFATSLEPVTTSVTKMGQILLEPQPLAEAPVVQAVAQTVEEPKTLVVDDPVGEEALEEPVARAQAVVVQAVTIPDKPRATSTSSPASTAKAPVSSTDELSQARAILAGLIAKYPILAGTTVTMGTTPGGYQAVAYYQSGRIIVSPTHTASLSTILNHEVWHIIDWRDNGQIDWGENIPPK